MKLKALALAALLAASGAHAAVDSGVTSGNGSLLATVAYGTSTAGASATFDLGLSYSDVAAWQGLINTHFGGGATTDWYRSWNLATGVATGTGISESTVGTYSTIFSQFNTAAAGANATSTAQLSVFAFDGLGTAAGAKNVLTTAGAVINNSNGVTTAINPTNGVPTVSNFNGIFTGTNFTSWMSATNIDDTHATSANGANLAAPGENQYFNKSSFNTLNTTGMFDINGQYAGSYAAGTTTFAGEDKSLPFYLLTTNSTTTSARSVASVIGYDFNGLNGIELDANSAAVGGGDEIGRWTLQGDVLTFAVPVPEPESYAMLLAGLGLMGAIARRRKQA